MRICLVSSQYPPETATGGIGTQTWNKAHGLARLGHDVEVLSCSPTLRDRPMRSAVESGIMVHRLHDPSHGALGECSVVEPSAYFMGFAWAVLEGLQALLADREFDLINFPEYGGEGVAFQLNRSTDRWTPVIVQLHAPLEMFAERTGWPERSSRLYRTGTFLERESIKLADGWMASSANIADFAARHYDIPRDRIDVVHCGVDCEQFRPPSELPTARRPTVLFAGTVAESKGIVTVAEAVLRLRSRYPDILLRVAGKENALLRKLCDRAAAAGAASSIEAVGFLQDRLAIVDLFQQADVFASPAEQEHGVANVYVEAMACGCPVIAGDAGGAPEAVTDGETGFLVAPSDVTAVAAAIDRVLEDRALRRRLGAAARRRVEDYFARDRYIERVLSAYRATIERSRQIRDRLIAADAS